MSNPGTLPVQGFHVAVEIDKQLALERTFGSTLEPGGTYNFPLGVAFTNAGQSGQAPRYVCATLTPLEDTVTEAKAGDNVFCLNIDESFYSLPPFPNPVQGLLEVALILPEAEAVEVMMATTQGEVLQNYTFAEAAKGLNTLQVDVSPFPSGVYLLMIRYQGRLNTYRLVVNP